MGKKIETIADGAEPEAQKKTLGQRLPIEGRIAIGEVAVVVATAAAADVVEVVSYTPVFAFPSLLSRSLGPFHGPEPVEEEVRVALTEKELVVPEQGRAQAFAHSWIHRFHNCCLRHYHLNH